MSEKRFAVVKFIEEGDDEDIVSEIPTSWITKDRSQCWWPPKNPKSFMAKQIPPEEGTWEIYKIHIDAFCDTLEEARKKATDLNYSSAAERGKGLRKRCTKKIYSPGKSKPPIKKDNYGDYYDSSSSDDKAAGTTPPPNMSCFVSNQDNEQINVQECTGTTDPFASAYLQNIELSETASRPTQSDKHKAHVHSITIVKPTPTERYHETEMNISLAAAKRSPLPNIYGIQTLSEIQSDVAASNDHWKTIKDWLQQFESRLCTIIGSLKVDLDNITEQLRKMEEPKPVKNLYQSDIAKYFPLKTKEEFDELTGKVVSNETHKLHLLEMMKQIGGNSAKDNINRIFKKLLTDHVAVQCTWKGTQTKFKLENEEVTMLIFAAVNSNFTVNHKEFENVVRDWLRHAKQRIERAERKQNDNNNNN